MKNVLAAAVLFVLFGMAAASGMAQTGNQDRSRFVGAWRLARLEQTGADGKTQRIDCCGMFVFTRDGHLSVQVMERSAQGHAPVGAQHYSQGGYEASYGTYIVDEHAHTFTFHVEGALVRSLIGKDLRRAYEFSGRELIVKPTSPDEHWRVAWDLY